MLVAYQMKGDRRKVQISDCKGKYHSTNLLYWFFFMEGCFKNIGTWDIPPQPYSPSQYKWNITSACSYECRKIKLFALKVTTCIIFIFTEKQNKINMVYLIFKFDECTSVLF